ncbi:pilus assembly FimT family protein [Sedimentisphaera salicampi]|uniref:Type II secretion system protein H n=1 Tax=Sedimentisphaera salicampi TaxID=1941349 RepID=A0A1W6LP49_9BACT|nr:prepilin-type N-terminal cleavage/methylation domain-containing protein [Sedimentisphaera salicampi]ARN57544.1 type II secretion system protein H [Sedimentisphaera salicampi]OXU14406.1 hypothetical protein SMSP1_01870 [Sedimentisphaera salicampi]
MRSAGTKAFTLIELILVMVIICTMLAVAAPSLRGFFSSRQLGELAEMFVVSARYARLQAISESRPYSFMIDESRKSYWVADNPGREDEHTKESMSVPRDIPKEVEITFEGFQREGNARYIEFDSLGDCKDCSALLEDSRGNRFLVQFRGLGRKFTSIELENLRRN